MTLDEYLQNPYNQEVYEVLVSVQRAAPNRYNLKVEPETLFNVAYALMVKLSHDNHPEWDFKNRYYYLPKTNNWLLRTYECDLVYCMIYYILSRRYKSTPKIRLILIQIESLVKIDKGSNFYKNSYWEAFSTKLQQMNQDAVPSNLQESSLQNPEVSSNQKPQEIPLDFIDQLITNINQGTLLVQQADWELFFKTIITIRPYTKDDTTPFILLLHSNLCGITIIDYRIAALNTLIEHIPQWIHHNNISTTKNEYDEYINGCRCLKYFYQLLRELCINNHDIYEELQANVMNPEYSNLEFVVFLQKMTPPMFFTLTQAFYDKSIHPIKGNSFLRALLDMYHYQNELVTNDIITCSKALFITDNYIHHYITHQMNMSVCMSDGQNDNRLYTDFHTFPLLKRNACFDEYWRIRQKNILNELANDNELVLPPTDEDAFQRLILEENKKVSSYKALIDLPCSAEREGSGASDVLKMGQYFIQYIQLMHEKKQQPNISQITQINVQGNYNDIHNNTNPTIKS
mgnify:CR=1 FL=1